MIQFYQEKADKVSPKSLVFEDENRG